MQFDFGPKEEQTVSNKLAEWAFRYAVSGPRAVGPAGLKGFLANQRLSPTELRDQVRRPRKRLAVMVQRQRVVVAVVTSF